jgi:hypothetical protein
MIENNAGVEFTHGLLKGFDPPSIGCHLDLQNTNRSEQKANHGNQGRWYQHGRTVMFALLRQT